jgi:hypothetical protein
VNVGPPTGPCAARSRTTGPALPAPRRAGGGGLWLAGQLTDGIEVDGGADNGGGAVVTLMVRCRSHCRQPSD